MRKRYAVIRPPSGFMRRSRAGALALVSLLAMALVGCGGGSSGGGPFAACGPASSNPLHLVSPGKLTIASDTTYTPAEYTDPNNPSQFVGYDMDLARELARRVNLTANIKTETFGNIINLLSGPKLCQQKYDMSISSFSINSSRLKQVDFLPYFIAGESTMVPKGNPGGIHSVADLCGKTVSAQTGTIELAELQALNGQNVPADQQGVAQQPQCKSKQIQILNFDSEEQVVQQVLNGRAVASYQDQPVTDYYTAQHASQLEHGFITPNSQGTEGIAVRKDNSALEDALKKALSDAVADGTYLRIMTHWGQQALACLPNCPPAS